jgi:hypothetical protein
MTEDKTFPIEVEDSTDLDPWYLDWGSGEWKKTYISITDLNEDGTPDYATSEMVRVRSRNGNQVFVCAPEDDDEPDEFPGTYWREDQ